MICVLLFSFLKKPAVALPDRFRGSILFHGFPTFPDSNIACITNRMLNTTNSADCSTAHTWAAARSHGIMLFTWNLAFQMELLLWTLPHLPGFITYHIKRPTSSQTTSGNRPRSPACGRRMLRERRCALHNAQVVRYNPSVSYRNNRRFSQNVLDGDDISHLKESASCIWARIP